MLYQELKTSRSRSKYNRSNMSAGHTGAGHPTSDSRRPKTYGPNGKYGQNSVVIMSNTAWEGSEEALRDSDTNTQPYPSPDQSGILKVEEVRVHHEHSNTAVDENSIELSSFNRKGSEASGRM